MSSGGEIIQRRYELLGNLPVTSRFEWGCTMWTVIAVDPLPHEVSGMRLNVRADGHGPTELPPETVVRWHRVMK